MTTATTITVTTIINITIISLIYSLKKLIEGYKLVKTRPLLHFQGYLAVPMSDSLGYHWGLAIINGVGEITYLDGVRSMFEYVQGSERCKLLLQHVRVR